MPHVIIVLAGGFEESEAVVAIDLLRRAQIQVTMLGLDSREVRSARDIVMTADGLLPEFTGPFDAIVLPGGPGTRNLAASPLLLDLVRKTHERGALCAAICSAPLVLAKAGILKGVRATCHPSAEKELDGAVIVTDQPVVVDGNIITGRSMASSIPFGLELIARLAGRDAAGNVAEAIVFDWS